MVGRKREQQKLIAAFQSKRAEFVGVFGRRRVGKTYLISESFAGNFVFRHAGLSPVEEEQKEAGLTEEESAERKMEKQLTHFHVSLLRDGDSNPEKPKSWEEAFFRMERLIAKKTSKAKKVVFLDELPWMDTPKSGFMTALEGFWNTWGCHQNNLLFIVAGSATSWMTDKLINNHGGLYGRLTREIRLDPMTLGECKELFKENGVVISDYDVAQAYMVFGGIPFYLNPMESWQSLAQYVDECFFSGKATLKREFDRLFESVFTNPDTMKSIVKALSCRRIGLTRGEIEERTGVKTGGGLTRYLNALADSDFIVEYFPFGMGKREPYYRLSDPFCWFYLSFVEGKKGLPANFWQGNTASQRIVSWRGLAFENLCFLHIPQIKAALGVAAVASEESAFTKRGDSQEQGGQIDLLILRADNIADLCEAKFASGRYKLGKAEYLRLSDREAIVSELLPKKHAVHKVLLTTFGIADNEYRWTFNSVLTLEDLMK